MYLGPLAGELAAELPFTLMHPKVVLFNHPIFRFVIMPIRLFTAGAGTREEKQLFREKEF